jgi:hypothetical protein
LIKIHLVLFGKYLALHLLTFSSSTTSCTTKKVTFEINKSLFITDAIIILNFSSWFKTCLENLRKINVLQKEIAMEFHIRQPTAYCLLLTAYCLLPTANCLLPTANCLLLTVNCLLWSHFCSQLGIKYLDI